MTDNNEEIFLLSSILGEMKQLNQLYLGLSNRGKNVDDEGLKTLTESIANLVELKELALDLRWNAISDEGLTQLPLTLGGGLKNLNKLHLQFSTDKRITDLGIELFSKLLESLCQLTELSLTFEAYLGTITDDGLSALSKSIAHLKMLTKLYLNFEGDVITSKGLNILSDNLVHLELLRSLTIIFSAGLNEISEAGIQALANSIKKLKHLQHLYLDCSEGENTITDECLKMLAEALSSLSELQGFHFVLNLGRNRITDAGLQDLFALALPNGIPLSYAIIEVRGGKNSVKLGIVELLSNKYKALVRR
jgi:hypothetical protein